MLLAAALAAAGLLWAGRAELPEHLARWSGSSAQVARLPDIARLSPTLDAGALARQLGTKALACRPVADDGQVCETALAEAGGVAAARLRAAWQRGRLQTVEILVPWWQHHPAVGALVQRLGPPSGNAHMGPEGRRLPALTWNLAQGTLVFPRAPGWTPWRWLQLHWRAADAPPA